MNPSEHHQRSRAQESRSAIQRLYIAMRHLFIRGNYKPFGASGEAMIEAMMTLRPEIYGSIADSERVELEGLLYIFQRLPLGIEECRYVKLISREGFEHSTFPPLVPAKRRRNCYRVDQEQMFIEMTRGRSDIYDVMTHLTFLYVEAEKIRKNSLDHKGMVRREWKMLRDLVDRERRGEEFNREVAYTYLSTILGRTFDETVAACAQFEKAERVNSLFSITYWMGHRSMEEAESKLDREITFSSSLREKIGHHIYGELWAQNIKQFLYERQLHQRPIHLISSNLHSVMNTLFAGNALKNQSSQKDLIDLALNLSLPDNRPLRAKVRQFAEKNGMTQIDDTSGTNISVQIFDLLQVPENPILTKLGWSSEYIQREKPVLLIMDYAFGEQAYETMDELLKPAEDAAAPFTLNVRSISIMGKAGILDGKKGDIMIPTAHIFEGSADNYPFENALSVTDFKDAKLNVISGPMVTVLGTSLQNRDILRFFRESSWKAIGLEMEGAHYQKAIQAASKIRKNIWEQVVLRYAYYASDNPLESGQTLASGSLGQEGVRPTYLITARILEQIIKAP